MKTRCLIFALLACLALPPVVRANPPLPYDLPLTPTGLRVGPHVAKKLITFEDLPCFAVTISTIVGWHDADHFLQLKDGKLFKVSASTGHATLMNDLDTLEHRLAALPDELWQGLETPPQHGGVAGPRAWPQKGKGGISSPSPDGKWTASVEGNNLFVSDKATKIDRQLTKDGSDVILNGKASWIYFEEIFHRKYQTFWWSPDSAYIAFLRFDDTNVPKFTLIDHTKRMQSPEVTRYPYSGQTNPTVKLGIVKVADGSVAWADLDDMPKDFLIARVGWTLDSKKVYCYVQDRVQTWLDVCTVPVEGGRTTKLFRDETKAWIEDIGPLHFLKDGSIVVLSERTGYKHLYHYTAEGQPKQTITTGEWDIKALQKIDETAGLAYFTCTKDSWLGSQAYRVKLDGTGLERLTKGGGTHEVKVSPDARWFTDTVSAYDMPPRILLHRADGSFVRVIDEAVQDQGKDQFKQGKHEFFEIKAPDGFLMNATVTLPPNYDKTKKYPVWFSTYGGPHAPTIKDKFSGASARDQALAALGFIVFHADPRSASGKGAISSWACYKQMGWQECKDIETCIHWLLESYAGADPKRVGMSGHSFGGYITAYCMTHTKLFAAGIAGAPVTDWRNYDSIYTERYMLLPKDNGEGYKKTSVVEGAKDLHGRLLIIHGMIDDNVHMQNTVDLMDALQKANREFEVMLYPHADHRIGGAHYQKLQNDFMKRLLN